MKNYDAVLFDLDGTLLETLPDIVDAVNETLSKLNINRVFDIDSGRSLIGDGPIELAKRALGQNYKNNEDLQGFLDIYMPLYASHQEIKTTPFSGIIETIATIKSANVKIYIATNKPQDLTYKIINKCFGDKFFNGIKGFEIGKPRKPSTEFINSVIEDNGLKGLRLLYVGDSKTDLETATNGNLDFCFVSWGYGCLTKDEQKMAKFIINKPCELLQAIGVVE